MQSANLTFGRRNSIPRLPALSNRCAGLVGMAQPKLRRVDWKGPTQATDPIQPMRRVGWEGQPNRTGANQPLCRVMGKAHPSIPARSNRCAELGRANPRYRGRVLAGRPFASIFCDQRHRREWSDSFAQQFVRFFRGFPCGSAQSARRRNVCAINAVNSFCMFQWSFPGPA